MHGTVEGLRSSPALGTGVERINYDSALNGRLSVETGLGNDVFVADDTSVTITLDGGAGDDQFQIGQIFGTRRTTAANIAAADVFPKMVATTRGYLSPGISAPLVAMGGTGNDEFTVYANQAELRLEGDDGNDLFVVRAFALARTDASGNILTDSTGNAIPDIGGSVDRPLDIRTGGGDDEVRYSMNAPVSIDGGAGYDKVIILGTEFPDDIVVTATAIYGAGVNVRYTTVESVEIDGLEGDDQFFIQSTAFGVAYRVIGGIGSDTINVAGDISTDIVVRDIEGASGTVDHLVTSTISATTE